MKNTYPFGMFIPKWGVFIFDLLTVALAHAFAILLIQTNSNIQIEKVMLMQQFFIVLLSFALGFLLFKPYKTVIRYFVPKDLLLIFYACSIGGLIAYLGMRLTGNSEEMPLLGILTYVLVIVNMVFYRVVVNVYRNGENGLKNSQNIAIVGAGPIGQVTKDLIEHDIDTDKRVVFFIDYNQNLHHKKCKNVLVYPEVEGLKKAKELNVQEVILAMDENEISTQEKSAFINKCLKASIKVKKVADPKNWTEGKAQQKVVDLNVEDLLERTPINIDNEKIDSLIANKVIFVTGAAGSIGSEIVNQLLSFEPQKIVLIDQSESGLYDLRNRLKGRAKQTELILELTDVTNLSRVKSIFNKYKPSIVFHAAAYKHVPMMEQIPYEAVRVNIGGTKNIVDCSVAENVEKFVMVSTDKAVNPTNVMGASKRVCELYVQSIAKTNSSATQFITTRFGNVLGSSGSVVPLFTRQIKEGGPITVTHKDITRFFMTIPEACQLVLQAAITGNNGEIYVFDMGQPVKIYDLAQKMISLSGLIPFKDIDIKVTGLRPGEKLYEELLATEETTLPTHHNKIFKARNTRDNFAKIPELINQLLLSNNLLEDNVIVGKILELVPEYNPQNSRFAKLKK